jgi:hypothetical protein
VSHFRGEAEVIFTTNHDSCRRPELTLGNQTQREGDFFTQDTSRSGSHGCVCVSKRKRATFACHSQRCDRWRCAIAIVFVKEVTRAFSETKDMPFASRARDKVEVDAWTCHSLRHLPPVLLLLVRKVLITTASVVNRSTRYPRASTPDAEADQWPMDGKSLGWCMMMFVALGVCPLNS